MATYSARSAAGLAVMVQWAQTYGMTPAECLSGTKLTVGALAVPDAEISGRQELKAIANVVAALGDRPGLGLDLSRRYPVTAYGVWGFALISSRTLREAIDLGLRYIRLTYAFCRFEARVDGDELSLVVDASPVPPSLRRFVLERDAAAVPILTREILGTLPQPRRVSFALPDPGPVVDRFAEMFGTMPEFEAQETVLAFSADQLDLPLPQASPHTAAAAAQECRALLQQREARAGLAGRVRDLLLADPAGPPSLDDIANDLRMSARTLRRQLQSEGTSVRNLLNEVRQHLAIELLNSGLSVEQVSARLGYTEVSNFSHAFRRWSGRSPREHLAGRRTTRL